VNLHLILKRVFAYGIDILLLFVVLAPAVTLAEWLFHIKPQTPLQVWIATAFSFSIPAWMYFILSDHSKLGATLGKRLFRLQGTTQAGSRPTILRAFARATVKLLPWEMPHIFGFALAEVVTGAVQAAGLITANILGIVYLAILVASQGRRSLHDLLAGTQVGAR
jgi:uncharacterized RDD family membrane protein YckC